MTGTAADPSWFYSSLSQVTAAVVGFVGGFLVLLLQQQISAWRELLVQLETGQTRWWLTSDTFHQKGQEEWIPQLHVERQQRWAELTHALAEKERARMPLELVVGGDLPP
jgi:hypothetical protein